MLFRLCWFTCACLAYAQAQPPSVPAASDKPKPIEKLEQSIVVTGTWTPLPLDEADRAITVIPARRDLPFFNSISDLLNLDTSTDLRERSTNAVQSGLSIRGGSFGQTLVLLNGMRLNDVQSSNHNMDVPVPLESITQVEVLRGSGSAMYGSDAVAGVVNFVTAPSEGLELKVRGGVGNFGINQEGASLGWNSKFWDQQLAFSRDFSTGFIPNRDYRNMSLASDSFLRSSLGVSHITLALNDRPFGANNFYGPYNSWERTKGWFAGLRQELGKKTEVSFAYRRHSDLFVLYRDRPQVYTNRHIVDSYQASIRRRDQLSRNVNLFYGAEVLGDSIASNNLGNHSKAREAAYGGIDVRALGRFSFSASAREEIFRNMQKKFSPSASAGLWLSPAWKLRASVSRAFRLPTFTDLYYKDPSNVGNPLLQPETAWGYEGGVDFHPSGKIRADLTVFQRREKNGIDFVRTNPTAIWRAINFQALNFTGFEAGTKVEVIRGQVVDFRYTLLEGAQNVLNGQQSKYVFNYARHSGLIAWQAALGKQATVRTRLGVVERFGRDPYAVLDVFLARTRGAIRPYLRMSNLTDTYFEEFFGVPTPGRSAVIGVEWVVFSRK